MNNGIDSLDLEPPVRMLPTRVGELNLSVVEELQRRGVGVPLPQREVRLIDKAV